MENSKRCGNCGRYPFCNKTNGASCYCDNWIKRKMDEVIIYKGKKGSGYGNKN